MPTFRGLSGTTYRETLSIPGMTPRDIGDPEMNKPESVQQIGKDGTVTAQADMAPTSETRVNIANRALARFSPGTSYANVDRQKGGAPGNPGSVITSENPEGITLLGTAPDSPVKHSYGLADWQDHIPTAVPMHTIITKFANPNRPQVNPTPFNNEGPNQNTKYTAPSPWAAGIFIG